MARISFQVVSVRGVRRWTDSEGKKHQETRKFWQTVNPFNKNEGGTVKTSAEIADEVKKERDLWLAGGN